MLDSFVVCDLETTGLTPRQHEIIEFGLVLVEGGQIKDTFYSLVRPKQKLPVSIRCLTGLDDEQLKDSPELCVILPRVLDFLHDYPLVGHNVGFDKEFLEAAAGKLNNPTYDTLELARIVLTFAPSYRLSDLCSFLVPYGIKTIIKNKLLCCHFQQLTGRGRQYSIQHHSKFTPLFCKSIFALIR